MKQLKKKIGLIIAISGPPSSGKSATVIKDIERSPRWNYIYDKNREYIEKKRLSENTLEHSTIFYSLKLFRNNLHKFQNSNIILEDAITFIKFYREDDLLDLITAVAHRGNCIYLLFHDVQSIPKYMLTFINYIIVLPTDEDFEFLKHSRPKLYRILVTENAQLPYIFCNQRPNY